MLNQRKFGVVLSYIAQLIHILINLVYTPIMLRLVGQSEYGLYQMVYSVVSSLGILNFGFNAAYTRFYSRYKIKNDTHGLAVLNGMFITVFTVLAAVVAVLGCGLIFNIEWVLGSNLTADELSTARILMILMVINLVIAFPNSVFDCYITAQEQFIFQKLLIICQHILNPVVTLPLLILGYGSVALIGVTTAITAANLSLSLFYCIRKLKMEFCFRGFQFSLLREMSAFTFFIFLGHIIDQVNWSVDKFLLGRYVGTAAVAVYGLASTLNAMYMQLSTAISSVFTPGINVLVAQGNSDKKLTDMFIKVGRIQFYVLSLVVIGFIAIGKPFVLLWGGMEYEQTYYVALLLIIPVMIPLSQNLGIEIQRAKNMHQTRAIVYSCIAVCNVLLSIPLIQMYGAVGAATGTAISLLIGNGLFMNWYYHKRIGLNILRFWKEILSIIPSMVIPCIFGFCIYNFASIDSWLQLMVSAMLIVIVYLLSVYTWGFNSYEKELVQSVCKRLLRKKE